MPHVPAAFGIVPADPGMPAGARAFRSPLRLFAYRLCLQASSRLTVSVSRGLTYLARHDVGMKTWADRFDSGVTPFLPFTSSPRLAFAMVRRLI